MISGNDSDNLDAVSSCRMQNGAAPHPANGDAVHVITGGNGLGSCADNAGEKAKRIISHSGVSKPANIDPNGNQLRTWKEWHKLLWEVKDLFWRQDDRSVAFPVGKNDSVVV